MMDVFCSQTGALLGSLDVTLPPGLRGLVIPTGGPGLFGQLQLTVGRFVDLDGVAREVLQIDPGLLPALRNSDAFKEASQVRH